LNLLLAANPNSPEEYKQRGIIYLQMEQTRAAKADLERYLELAPDAPDRAAVKEQVASLTRWMVGMN
jgi:regulator of sirC expression with transglutaminase-like and TPR domain